MAWPLCDRKGHIPHHHQTPPVNTQTRNPTGYLCLQCPPLPDPILEHLLDLPPNLVLIDGSEEYEVESIVDSKYRYRCLHYLVKFKGWLDSDNEWLPADHLANAPNIMQDFHLCYPSTPAPCHMSHLQQGGPS